MSSYEYWRWFDLLVNTELDSIKKDPWDWIQEHAFMDENVIPESEVDNQYGDRKRTCSTKRIPENS
jgi:hypothetical protein